MACEIMIRGGGFIKLIAMLNGDKQLGMKLMNGDRPIFVECINQNGIGSWG